MKPAAEICQKLGLAVEVRVLSAHRTPEEAAAFVQGRRPAGRQGVHLRRRRRGAPGGRRRGAHHPPGDRRADRRRRAAAASTRCSRRCRCRRACRWRRWPSAAPRTPACWPRRSSPLADPALAAKVEAERGRAPQEGAWRATPKFARERREPDRRRRTSRPRPSPRSGAARWSPTRRRRSTASASTPSTSRRWNVCAQLKGRGEKAISVLVDGAAMLARALRGGPAAWPPTLMRRHWPGR